MIRLKTPSQIEGIRASCRLAANTLLHLEPLIVPGVTTAQIDAIADRYIREHGGIPASLGYRGFPRSVCTSVNEVVCHGIPSDDVVLREGDILNVDVATILGGYFGDTCRMYEVGSLSSDAASLLRVARMCLDLGIKQVQPGRRLGMIGHAITTHALLNGCTVVYEFCGHGTGLQFHEEPQVNHASRPDSGPILEPGMIFTIEPMINFGEPFTEVDQHDGWTVRTMDRKLSAQYEHTILVTDSGHEILTLSNW